MTTTTTSPYPELTPEYIRERNNLMKEDRQRELRDFRNWARRQGKIAIYKRWLSHSPQNVELIADWRVGPRNLMKAKEKLEEERARARTVYGHGEAVWMEIGGQPVEFSWPLSVEEARDMLSGLESGRYTHRRFRDIRA